LSESPYAVRIVCSRFWRVENIHTVSDSWRPIP
jgi:hypothetical protein